MRYLYFIIVVLTLTTQLVAQSVNKLITEANDEFLIGNYSSAIQYCKKALLKNSNTKDVNFLAGLAYYNLNDTLNAITFFDNEIKINKKDYRSYLYKSKLTIKNYNSANKGLSEAIIMNPDNFLLYLEKGNLNYYHHKYKEAVEHYNKAISLQSHLNDAYYKLGFCVLKLNDTINACKYWNKIEELDDYKEYEFIQKICTKPK